MFALLPPFGRLVVGAFFAGFVLYGSTKNGAGSTNDTPSRMSAPRRTARTPVSPVTEAEIAAGYRIPEEASAGLLSVPEGAVTNEFWRLRGAHDDAFRVGPEGWWFPYRDGVLTGLTVLARGEVRPDVGTLYFPVPVTNGVSLLPASRWSLLPDGAVRIQTGLGDIWNGRFLLDGSAQYAESWWGARYPIQNMKDMGRTVHGCYWLAEMTHIVRFSLLTRMEQQKFRSMDIGCPEVGTAEFFWTGM